MPIDGGALRFLLIFFIGLTGYHAQAYQARVLIDESSLSKQIVGQFELQCLKPQTCSGKAIVFPTGHWQVLRFYNRLQIKNIKTGQKKRFRGKAFRLKGAFKIDQKALSEVRLFFLDRKTHWVIHLPVDQYLYGVMTAEVPASWPKESLKAQAVASRTYFLYKKMERLKFHFDVRSDTLDQVFSMKAQKYRSIIEAVDQTHGMVLISDKKEQIFPAYFHSDCGGQTSSEGKVWRKPAALNKKVKDPYCKTASKNNWSYLIDRSKLMARLQKVFYLPKGVRLERILPRTHEGARAHTVDFLFSGSILKRISANDLRKILGFGKLKSTYFNVRNSINKVIFSGRGYGHGVGMCQWGAQRWARKGKSFGFILKHYYPGAKLRKISPDQLKSLQAQLVY